MIFARPLDAVKLKIDLLAGPEFDEQNVVETGPDGVFCEYFLLRSLRQPLD